MTEPTAAQPERRVTPYAWYALGVLWLSIFFNYTDRQIFSILAEHIKRDLDLTDAQLGMLYGTSFVVLYTVVSLVIVRLADTWRRTRLMGYGMLLWSAMTAAIGIAPNFGALTLARSGVGVGEATANPCSHSLISDFFPARRRSLALSLYLTGMSAGLGLSVVLGAFVAKWWDEGCSRWNGCGIAGWQAAFILIGLAGIPVALLVLSLREPVRGTQEGAVADPDAMAAVRPWRTLAEDAAAVLPVINLWLLAQRGGGGAVALNLGIGLIIATIAVLLWQVTGDAVQWLALGYGLYAIASWAQLVRYQRPDVFAFTLGSRFFWYLTLGCGAFACVQASVSLWTIPYALRSFPISVALAGSVFGPALALGAAGGTVLGGALTTVWQRRDARAPIWIAMLGGVLVVPVVAAMLLTGSWQIYAVLVFAVSVIVSLWAAPIGGLILNAVRPEMRASAASFFSMMQVMLSLSIGPYATGKISSLTGSLGTGLAATLVLIPVSLTLLFLASRRLDRRVLSS